MPLIEDDNLPTKFPDPDYLVLDGWKKGVISLLNKANLPRDALEKADNCFLYEDGKPGPRPGIDWFGTAPGKVPPSISPSASRSPSASVSPSASSSPSSSISSSPSASRSPSASISPSISPSSSASASRSPSASISSSPSPSSGLEEWTSSFRFDGHTTAANDSYSVWANDSNAFDNDDTTFAYTTSVGSVDGINRLFARGTTAPTSGPQILEVQARFKSFSPDGGFIGVYIKPDPMVAGTPLYSATANNSGSADWSSWGTVDVPSDGWSWNKLRELSACIYGGLNGTQQNIYQIEVRAYTTTASTSPSSSLSLSVSNSPSASVSPSASNSPSDSPSLSPSDSPSLSPSASNSPSISASISPSSSRSPSASLSPSASHSPSASVSPSISPSPSEGSYPEIDGYDYFDADGDIHLVAAAGGYIYRSLDDGETWDYCSGARYTAGFEVNFNQNGDFLYIVTGEDPTIRYDGSTTLLVYTALNTPAAPTVSETGLAGSGYSYYYKQVAVNAIGMSIASPASSVVQTSVPRDAWDGTTNFAVVTPAAFQSTQTRADLYISENNVDFFYIGSTSVSGDTFKDDGSAIPIPGTTPPVDNTTTGPRVAELVNVGSRQYGVRDKNNRYRIHFSGAGQYSGSFALAYDGGWLDWQPGGKYFPVHTEDYRDGKGSPYATIFCDSADGQGCIIQMSLDTLTIGDVSITVPNAYKLPGSRGTPAWGSVVNVLNDYYFYNSQAFYNLGSRMNFPNLLSTDEISANIRPDVKQISATGESKICSVYYDGKVYFSVPYNSDVNNRTMVYDTERKAWLPNAFTVGFKKFLRYTDKNGVKKLLALKQGDSRLSQISTSIYGDYGNPFTTLISTGLYSVSKNRFEFQRTEEGEIEISVAEGTSVFTMLGYQRNKGFRPIKSKTLTVSASAASVNTWSNMWDRPWDQTSEVQGVTTENSIKKYMSIQKELNSIQWQVSTNGLRDRYILRTLQSWGTPTQAGKPRSWKMR